MKNTIEMEPLALLGKFDSRLVEIARIPATDKTPSWSIRRNHRKPTFGQFKPGHYSVSTEGRRVFRGLAVSPDHALRRAQKREAKH